jgi:hypothetical protein
LTQRGPTGGGHNPLLLDQEAPMIDPMSTQFSAVQRETHKGVIGQQEYDRRTYEVLLGDGTETAPRRGRGAALAAAAVTVLVVLGAALWWIAAL